MRLLLKITGTMLTLYMLVTLPLAAYIHNHPESVKEPVTFNITFIIICTIISSIFVIWQFEDTTKK